MFASFLGVATIMTPPKNKNMSNIGTLLHNIRPRCYITYSMILMQGFPTNVVNPSH